jgi:hypothetical protein
VSSNALFTNNRIGGYVTKLPMNLCLENEWEVGLSEISYTRSWYNITKVQELCVVDGSGILHQKTVLLSPGYYKDPEELLHTVNKLLKEYKGSKIVECPSFEYNVHSHKVSMVLGRDHLGDNVYCTMGAELRDLLGFESSFFEALFETSFSFPQASHTDLVKYAPIKKRPKPIKALVEAANAIDIDAGIHSLFVYCDIIKPSFVGDSYSKLLRVVKIPQQLTFGQQWVITYDNPQYFKLCSHTFDTIDLRIRDGTGTPIDFQFGRSIATLHFRRKNGP